MLRGAMTKLHAINDSLGRLFHERHSGRGGAAGSPYCDILVTPALPIRPFAAAGPMPREAAPGAPFSSPLHAVFPMYPFNFSGHPACVVRVPGAGGGGGGVAPVAAVQLVAPMHREDLLLQVAQAYEQESGCFATWPAPSEILAQAKDLHKARL
jgi:Asp-tRNA(Asn)/Glu-tRNA(Gln) amidotransferase A subunit family amidase